MNISENRERLREHLINFHGHVQYQKKLDPEKGIGPIADGWLDQQISMEEGMKAYNDAVQQIRAQHVKILMEIRATTGPTFYGHLAAYIKDRHPTDDHEFEFVPQPEGKCQKVSEYGRAIREEWVVQQPVGDSGDSWEGTICVKIDEGNYLKFHFSM
jgi:hypothetical protein